MPRKTRKQKIKTVHHQPQSLTHAITMPKEEPHTHPTSSTFSFQRLNNQETPVHVAVTHDPTDMYLRRDLLKTVLLALTAVGILIALSFILK